jgi:two-component system sensor histidine kinase RegB
MVMTNQPAAGPKPSTSVGPQPPAVVAVLSLHDALQGLRLLAVYRVLTPLFQAATMLVVADHFELEVRSPPVLFMLALEVVVAVATLLWLRTNVALSEQGLQLQALLDIALFATMLYLTGGPANPFAPLFVLPVMIVGMSLSTGRLWFTVFVTLACYVVLRDFHVPLVHPLGHGAVDRLHMDGMLVNYAVTSAMLVFFSSRLFRSLRRHAEQAQLAQEAQMRSETVAAIGALAASSAHQLGSPLSTMAVVVAELRHRHPHDAELARDVEIVEAQLAVCNDILAQMASAGDDRRAQSAVGAPVDVFVETTLQRVRSTHPEATIDAQLDGPRPAPQVVIEESLRQTLSNVLNNAVRVSPRHVSVVARWNRNSLDVTVSDQGPGFTAQALQVLGKHALGPGQRQSGMGMGMGMGLLLGAETLQRLGGTLHLSNNPDGGARVHLHVPLAAILMDDGKSASHA